MNISISVHKEKESSINDTLYENIKYLTYLYPPTKEFEEVFKKNMFLKNNKTGFQQVIYYLFTVFDANLTLKKITTWPLYDVKNETQFRNEIIAYVNYLNSEYEHANLPTLLMSHLIVPGGYKISKFLLSLSIFVMYEVLKKEHSALLLPIKPHKDTTITNLIIKGVENAKFQEEKQIKMKYDTFHKNFEDVALKAAQIVEEQKRICEEIRLAKTVSTESETKLINRDDLTEFMKRSENNLIKFEETRALCEEGLKLVSFLTNEKCCFKFDKNNCTQEVLKQLKFDGDKLDLSHLFDNLVTLLKTFELPVLTNSYLKDQTSTLTEINEKCSALYEKILFEKNELIRLCEKIQDSTDISK